MLTPIRTRTRRKPPWRPQDGTPKPRPSGGSKGGRPMMSFKEKQESSQSSQSTKRARLLTASVKAPRFRKKKASRLETLPVELIEKIFLYSLNVNLPRASRSLAAAVSSERIYRTLLLLALWDDSSALILPSEPASEVMSTSTPRSQSPLAGSGAKLAVARLLRPFAHTKPLAEDERRALQKSIFRCRWCTIKRLLDLLPDLMRLAVHRHWFGTGIIMSADEEERLNVFLAQQQNATTTATTTFEGVDGTNNNSTLSINSNISLTITTVNLGSDLPRQTIQHHTLSILHIPDHLLRGSPTESFTQLHTHLLETIRISAGFNRSELQPATSTVTFSRDALQQGIETALISHNSAALTTLLKMDEYVFRTLNTPTAVSPDTDQIPPYMLPTEHFHTAIRMAKTDLSFFLLLLRASAESMPADDSEITQWAMDLRGNPLGLWLLDFMLVLPQQRDAARVNPVDGSMFYLGRANSQIGMVGRFLREVLGVEELGSWMEESFMLDSG